MAIFVGLYPKRTNLRNGSLRGKKRAVHDCRSDLSHQERMSPVLRYVVLNPAEVKVIENFMDIIPVQVQIGKRVVELFPGFSRRLWPSY